MPEREYTDISDWYLARLRSRASELTGGRVTPHTLVQSDSNLIREMVNRLGSTRKKQSAEILQSLKEGNRSILATQKAIFFLAGAGNLLLLLFLLSTFLCLK